MHGSWLLVHRRKTIVRWRDEPCDTLLPITREALGSFLVRTMDLLATDGLLDQVAFQQGEFGESLRLTDVALGVEDGADRVIVILVTSR